MPIYKFECGECKGIIEKLMPMNGETPQCCGVPMSRMPAFPALVLMMGEGGYPSRRKFLKGSAPYTGRSIKPWLSYDPNDTTVRPMGSKAQE